MNQKKLAGVVGVTAMHINALLNGRRNPSAKLANSLEEHTGIPRDLWVFGTPAQRMAAWKKFQRVHPK